MECYFCFNHVYLPSKPFVIGCCMLGACFSMEKAKATVCIEQFLQACKDAEIIDGAWDW